VAEAGFTVAVAGGFTAVVGFTAAEAFTVAEATLTAVITAVAMVGMEVTTAGIAAIGAILATAMGGDSVLALAGDPIGLHTLMGTGIARGGALRTIILIPTLTMYLPAIRILIHTHTMGAATLPRHLLAGILTATPRRDHRGLR
jgi:hypothetical protein